MSRYLNNCNLFIFLWCMYYMQGVLYAPASLISKSIMLIMTLMMFLYAIKVNYEYRSSIPPFIKLLNAFLAILTVYGIIWMFSPTHLFLDFSSQPIQKYVFLQEIYLSLMPIYPMYYFAQKGYLTEKVIRVFSLILLFEFTCVFFYYQNMMIQEALEYGSMRDEFTNNVGYKFLHIFPLLLFWDRKKLIQIVLILYMYSFIIMSFKRGAILIASIGLIWYIIQLILNSSRWHKILITACATLLIGVGYKHIESFYQKSDYFQSRVADTLSGDASERNEHFPILMREILQESSLLKILFGRGASSTVGLTGNFAHNDWLELTICHGLLGLILYLIYYILLYRQVSMCKHNKSLHAVMVMCLIIVFVSSFFSMSLYGLTLPITMSLSYCFAKNVNQENCY